MPILCLEPLSQALAAAPSWLGPTAAGTAILVAVVRTAVCSTVVLVGLLARDKERAERALPILERGWSRQERSG